MRPVSNPDCFCRWRGWLSYGDDQKTCRSCLCIVTWGLPVFRGLESACLKSLPKARDHWKYDSLVSCNITPESTGLHLIELSFTKFVRESWNGSTTTMMTSNRVWPLSRRNWFSPIHSNTRTKSCLYLQSTAKDGRTFVYSCHRHWYNLSDDNNWCFFSFVEYWLDACKEKNSDFKLRKYMYLCSLVCVK